MTPLTPRQFDCLLRLADGSTRKEVAGQMGISEHTVKGYTHQAFRRLGVTTLIGAYYRLGWLRPLVNSPWRGEG